MFKISKMSAVDSNNNNVSYGNTKPSSVDDLGPDGCKFVFRPVAVQRTARKTHFPSIPVKHSCEINNVSSSLYSHDAGDRFNPGDASPADLPTSFSEENLAAVPSIGDGFTQASSLEVLGGSTRCSQVPSSYPSRATSTVMHGTSISSLDEAEWNGSDEERNTRSTNGQKFLNDKRRASSLPTKKPDPQYCQFPPGRKMYSCIGVGPKQHTPRKPILRRSRSPDTNMNPIKAISFNSSDSKMGSANSLTVQNQDDFDIHDLDTTDDEMLNFIVDKPSVPSRYLKPYGGTKHETRTPPSSGKSSQSTLLSVTNTLKARVDQTSEINFPKVIFRGKTVPAQFPALSKVCKQLKDTNTIFDKTTALGALKQRILRGENVSYEEIKAIHMLNRIPPRQRCDANKMPWTKQICCDKGLVFIPTPNKPCPARNTFGKFDELRIPHSPDEITLEHFGRRQFMINLAGFEDHHISLYLEGKNRVVIRAQRHDGLVDLEPMTVTESVLLPPDLSPENLRIVRTPSGTTIVEESWRY